MDVRAVGRSGAALGRRVRSRDGFVHGGGVASPAVHRQGKQGRRVGRASETCRRGLGIGRQRYPVSRAIGTWYQGIRWEAESQSYTLVGDSRILGRTSPPPAWAMPMPLH